MLRFHPAMAGKGPWLPIGVADRLWQAYVSAVVHLLRAETWREYQRFGGLYP